MAARRSARPRQRRFDDDAWQPDTNTDTNPETRRSSATPEPDAESDTDPDDDTVWSTYRHATRGPQPVPRWVVTDPRATDDDLGVVKTGKEAELSLVRRSVPDQHPDPDGDTRSSLLAAKRYRAHEHRLFHRDSAYLEGRRVRKSREMRAMHLRTDVGKALIADQWANAEFAILGRLWLAGAPVPYPVQLYGTEIMMEFIGTADGVAAPRLAETRPSPNDARRWYEQLVDALVVLATEGVTHGDLSAYNVLVHDDRLVLIDLPQVVDVVGNPRGFEFLRRDCENITTWFRARGVAADPAALAAELTVHIM